MKKPYLIKSMDLSLSVSITATHWPPPTEHSPTDHSPTNMGGLDSYFRLYIYMCVCVCAYVSRHRGHTVHVRDLYFWIYSLHIHEKKSFFVFWKKSVFRFFSVFFTFQDRMSMLSWCMVYCGYTYILGYRAYFCYDFGL